MRIALPLLLLIVVAALGWKALDGRRRQAEFEEQLAACRHAAAQRHAKAERTRGVLRRALSGERAAAFPRPGTTDCVLYNPGQFPTARPQPVHTGTVLAADAEHNVYAISLGAEDGVEEGFVYIVSRDDEYVGILSIKRVQAKQSVGRLMQEISRGNPLRGDSVLNGR